MWGVPRPSDPRVASGSVSKLAVRLDGVEPFEPLPGRAMTGWVLVPLEHAERWPALAEQAWGCMSS